MALHRSSGSADQSYNGDVSEPSSSTDAPVFYNPDEDSPGLWSPDSSNGSLGSRRQGGRRNSVAVPPPMDRTASDGRVEPSAPLQARRSSRSRLYAFPNGCEAPQRPAESGSLEAATRRSSTGSLRPDPSRRRRGSRASLYGLPDDCTIGLKLVSTTSSSSSASDLPMTSAKRRGSRASLYGLPDDRELNAKLVDVSRSQLGSSRRCSISSTGSEGLPKGRSRRVSRASLYGLSDGEEIAPVVPEMDESDGETKEDEVIGYKSEKLIYRPPRKRLDSWSDNEECDLNITHEGRRPNDKDSDYEDDLRDYRKGGRFREEI